MPVPELWLIEVVPSDYEGYDWLIVHRSDMTTWDLVTHGVTFGWALAGVTDA